MRVGTARALADTRLITIEGWGHGFFNGSRSTCAQKYEVNYLLERKLPPAGTTWSGEARRARGPVRVVAQVPQLGVEAEVVLGRGRRRGGLEPRVLGELTRYSRNAVVSGHVSGTYSVCQNRNHLLVGVGHAPGVAEQEVLVDARLLHRSGHAEGPQVPPGPLADLT